MQIYFLLAAVAAAAVAITEKATKKKGKENFVSKQLLSLWLARLLFCTAREKNTKIQKLCSHLFGESHFGLFAHSRALN
jgi:hypothetical protein